MTETPVPDAPKRIRGKLPALLLLLPAATLFALHGLWAFDPVLLGRILGALHVALAQLWTLLLVALLLFVLLALLYPPLIPILRLWLARLGSQLNVDRRAIRQLLARTEHYASPPDLIELARHYNDAGQPKLALPPLVRARQEGSEDPRLHHEAARAFFEIGHKAEARANLARALELDPKLGNGSARLLAIEAHLECGDAASAEAEAQRWEREHGPSPLVSLFLARAQWILGKKDEARDTLRALLALPREQLGRRRDPRIAWARARAKLALRTGGRP